MSDSISKPRKKPQFLHLHPTQAAKAKQAWVNKVKLRSQWAKEKRKVQVQASDILEENEMEIDSRDEEKHEQHLSAPEKGVIEEQAAAPSRKRKRSSHSDGKPSHQKTAKEAKPLVQLDEKQRRERLRELSRQAYAPESLHTFKSDPLHRRRGDTHSRGAASTRTARGRGQPNMKLRMNALLEKIRLDAGPA